jgi:hypothetical protein
MQFLPLTFQKSVLVSMMVFPEIIVGKLRSFLCLISTLFNYFQMQ